MDEEKRSACPEASLSPALRGSGDQQPVTALGSEANLEKTELWNHPRGDRREVRPQGDQGRDGGHW